MNQTKIIFFDIDGTILDMETEKISAKMVETLQRLRAKGIKICIATGRAPTTLPKFEGIVFDAFLTFNGSYCYDESGVIFSNPIGSADVQRILHNATNLGRPVSIAIKEGLAANGADEDLRQYYSFAQLELTVSDNFAEICRGEVYQVMLGCRESDYPAILEGVQDAKITAWWDRAADVIPANGGKGTGIRKVLEHYGLWAAEAMAFGDGNNDIEMLEAVGTGVAMENGSARLKAIADDVCGPVGEDGIYHYCMAHGLI